MASVKPSLDYYHGRKVEKIADEGGGDWAIVLEGNVIIRNHDARRTAVPDEIEGLLYLFTSFTEKATVMQFGTDKESGREWVVNLSPLKYSISGEGIDGEVFPQRTEELEMLLPEAYQEDYLAERESEGPDDFTITKDDIARGLGPKEDENGA